MESAQPELPRACFWQAFNYDRQYKMTGERIRSLFEMLPDKG